MCVIVLMKVHFCIIKVHADYDSLDSSAVPGTQKSTVVVSEQVLTIPVLKLQLGNSARQQLNFKLEIRENSSISS